MKKTEFQKWESIFAKLHNELHPKAESTKKKVKKKEEPVVDNKKKKKRK